MSCDKTIFVFSKHSKYEKRYVVANIRILLRLPNYGNDENMKSRNQILMENVQMI